jgi:hypothetical protein
VAGAAGELQATNNNMSAAQMRATAFILYIVNEKRPPCRTLWYFWAK